MNFTNEYQLWSTDLTYLFEVAIQYVNLTCVIVIVTLPCKVRLFADITTFSLNIELDGK